MAVNLMWAMLVVLIVSRVVARHICAYSPPVQEYHGIKMSSDPTSIIFIISVGFGGMISLMANVKYSGVVLGIIAISLSVCKNSSIVIRIYCSSIVVLVSLSSIFDIYGKDLVLISAFIPLIGLFIIKGCELVSSKIDW